MLDLIESIFRFIIDPLTLWMITFGLLIMAFRLKYRKFRRSILFIFGLLSIVLSSPYLLYLVSRPLENFALNQFKYADASRRDHIACNAFEGVITLGGVIPNSDYDPIKGIQLTAGAERITEPVRLFNLCPNFKLVYTSYGKVIQDGVGESELARDIWEGVGVPESSIIIENGSTNTHENAVQAKKLLEGDSRWLLVSSASHLKRAHATFRKAGIRSDAIPVDYLFSKRPKIWAFAPLSTVSGWQVVFHEYLGGIYYSIKGWT